MIVCYVGIRQPFWFSCVWSGGGLGQTIKYLSRNRNGTENAFFWHTRSPNNSASLINRSKSLILLKKWNGFCWVIYTQGKSRSSRVFTRTISQRFVVSKPKVLLYSSLLNANPTCQPNQVAKEQNVLRTRSFTSSRFHFDPSWPDFHPRAFSFGFVCVNVVQSIMFDNDLFPYPIYYAQQQQQQADEKSPLPSADRLSVSFIMGERDGSSVGTSSVRMDSPVGGHHNNQHFSNHQPHYLDIGK